MDQCHLYFKTILYYVSKNAIFFLQCMTDGTEVATYPTTLVKVYFLIFK